MKKKFTTLIVLALFIFSIMPMAFAEDDNTTTVYNEETNTTTEVEDLEETNTTTEVEDLEETNNDTEINNTNVESQPVATLYRTQEGRQERVEMTKERYQEMRKNVEDAKDKYQERREAAGEKLKEHRENAQERLKEMRENTKQRMENAIERIKGARERYEQFKEHYVTAKNKYQEKKGQWNDAKDRWEKCKNSESEECQQAENRVKEEAKPFLLNSADLVVKELERSKEKVMASEDLSEDEILEMVSDIEDRIMEVEEAKAMIEDLDENVTKEDINDAAKVIKTAWTHSKTSLKRHIGVMVNARLGNIVKKTDNLENKFESFANKLEENGADTTNLNALIEKFKADVAEAESAHEQAREQYKNAISPGEVDEAAKEAHDLMSSANEKLKDSRETMREIVKEIKSLNNGNMNVKGAVIGDNDENKADNENESEADLENSGNDEE